MLSCVKPVRNKQFDVCNYLGLTPQSCDTQWQYLGNYGLAQQAYNISIKKKSDYHIPENLTVNITPDVSYNSSLMDYISFCNFTNIPETFSKVFSLITVGFINIDNDNVVRAYKPLYHYDVDNSYISSAAFAPLINIYGDNKATLTNQYIKVAGRNIPVNKQGLTPINFKYKFGQYQTFNILDLILANRYINNETTLEKVDNEKKY
ncbi:MAG: hypothetical protein AB1782_12055 [Cyanobacteriota bacterium]